MIYTSGPSFDPKQLERVMIFVDGTNFFKDLHSFCQKNTLGSARLQYRELLKVIVGSRKLIRTLFYTTESNLEKFHHLITHVRKDEGGVRVNFKFGDRFGEGERTREKRVDTQLVTDFLTLSFQNAFDTAIIFSGDADFYDAIENVKMTGKNVEVFGFRDSCSDMIYDAADVYYDANVILEPNLFLPKQI